jgi:hypothetical protein
MKTILKTIFGYLLLLSANTQAIEIMPSHSGSWYNPDQSGHGVNVEVVTPETLIIYWNTYHPDGTPMWLMSVAEIEGDTARGDAYHLSGMPFGMFDPAQLTKQSWGELNLTFLDCNNARLSYDSPLSHGGIPFGAGDIELVRLTFIDSLDCPPLRHGKFGNFSYGLDLGPFGGFPVNDFVWILRDGTLAYQATHYGEVKEIGYGQLTMIGEESFEFEATTSNGTRQGTGIFEGARVTLDLGELGMLSEPLDPAFKYAITLEDIAGDYSGPDLVWTAKVDETGAYNMVGLGGGGSGTLTIPEPGFNQLVDKFEFSTGTNHCLGVHHKATDFLLFICNRGYEVWTKPWFGGIDFEQ